MDARKEGFVQFMRHVRIGLLTCLLTIWLPAGRASAAEPSSDAGSTALDIVGRHKAVFEAPPRSTPSHHAIDAPLLGNGDVLAAMGGTPGRLQFYLNKNDLWVMRRDNGSHPCPLARLDLEVGDLEGASYHVEQDLLRAVTTGRFRTRSVELTLEAGVAARENVLWVKLSSVGGTLRGRAAARLPGADQAAVVSAAGGGIRAYKDGKLVSPRTEHSDSDIQGSQGDVQFVERRFEKGVMEPAGAACAVRVIGGGPGGELVVEPGKSVLVIACVRSRFDASDFRAAAIKRAAEFRAEELPASRQAHEAWWRAFWGRSFVEIPDKVLEQRYYLSHYVLASASRVKDFPPGLFGWVTTDRPAWNGDYHLNYNHVAPFYGLYAANHIEQADPCHEPILAALKIGHEWSLTHCRIKDGVLLPVGIGPKGSLAGAVLLDQKSNSAYSCVPLAFRWYATYDLDFARKAYPFVRDTAGFWENWLKFEEGRYVIYKDAIHEGSGADVNPILSLGLVRLVMDLAADMSKELGADADRRERWTQIRSRLSDYPTCTVRDLPRRFWPRHMGQDEATLNLPIFRYSEKGTPWYRSNTLGIQHIYPAGGIGLDSGAELLQRAHNQIRVLSRWRDYNGMNSIYAAAARVGFDPGVILQQMRSMLDTIGLPNGMIRGNPHGMEHQSIVPNAIQEMLLQSHEGVLRFFPCWPKDRDARFGTLRARGAFLVSGAIRSGRIAPVTILSEKGRDCTVVNPWPGRAVRIISPGQPARTMSLERLSFKTSPGQTINLRPAED